MMVGDGVGGIGGLAMLKNETVVDLLSHTKAEGLSVAESSTKQASNEVTAAVSVRILIFMSM